MASSIPKSLATNDGIDLNKLASIIYEREISGAVPRFSFSRKDIWIKTGVNPRWHPVLDDKSMLADCHILLQCRWYLLVEAIVQ